MIVKLQGIGTLYVDLWWRKGDKVFFRGDNSLGEFMIIMVEPKVHKWEEKNGTLYLREYRVLYRG